MRLKESKKSRAGDTAWAVRQILAYEKCVDARFVPFCDLAIQVGGWLVPLQPCFGVLTAATRERELERPFVVRQNASVGVKPQTDGLAILSNSIVAGNKKDSM